MKSRMMDDREGDSVWQQVNSLRDAGSSAEALRLVQTRLQLPGLSEADLFTWHLKAGGILRYDLSRPEEACSELMAACALRPGHELANIMLFHALREIDVCRAYKHLGGYLQRRKKNSPTANMLVQTLMGGLEECSVTTDDVARQIKIEGRRLDLSWPDELQGMGMEVRFEGIREVAWERGGPVVWNDVIDECELLNKLEESDHSIWLMTFEAGASLRFTCEAVKMTLI